MTKMAVLFDLDQTLVDTRTITPFRQLRQWRQVYQLITQLQPYPGISDLMLTLHQRQILVGIVTLSSRSFCDRLIIEYQWPIDTLVCRHDTSQNKPCPVPILKALTQLKVSTTQAIFVGDAETDIQAGKAAKVQTVGTLWGSLNPQRLIAANPDYICKTVEELHHLLLNLYCIF